MRVTYFMLHRINLIEIFLVQVSKARDVGVNSIVLFPKVPDALKVFPCHLNVPAVLSIAVA